MYNTYTVELLINGKPASEYYHEGKIYVEGRKNSAYEIEIKNPTSKRILAIVSVDGLNVLNGKPASTKDTGYVIRAYDSITIPGWTLDSKEVAKFTFSAEEKTYSELSGQGTTNIGVIGVSIFKEKEYYIPRTPRYYPYPYPYDDGFYPRHEDSWEYTKKPKEIIMTCSANSMSGESVVNSSGTPFSVCETGFSRTVSENTLEDTLEDTQIGTAFGEATGFATTNVSFNKESSIPDKTFIIYYDSKKGLERRGIQFAKAKVKKEPEAFPADVGCVPPAGYTRH